MNTDQWGRRKILEKVSLIVYISKKKLTKITAANSQKFYQPKLDTNSYILYQTCYFRDMDF
jgi:hypothetical protein